MCEDNVTCEDAAMCKNTAYYDHAKVRTSTATDHATRINYCVNYFVMIQMTNWRLLLYGNDKTRVKKPLPNHYDDAQPKFMFDGSLIFSTFEEVSHGQGEAEEEDEEGEEGDPQLLHSSCARRSKGQRKKGDATP